MRQFRGWIVAALATAVIVAVGAVLLVPGGPSPTPTPTRPAASPTPTPAAASPASTPSPKVPLVSLRLYFARDQLPPVGADVPAALSYGASPERRIRARFDALASADAPTGAFNAVRTLRTRPTMRAVSIAGSQAAVDRTVPNGDWGIGGSAATRGLIRQLVYTATEEPGVTSVLFTENGGEPTIVDGVQIDHAARRESVFGNARPGSTEPLEIDGPPVAGTLSTSRSVDSVAPALTRFVVTAAGAASVVPRFSVRVVPATDLGGTWEMDVLVGGASGPYRLALEDLRPWRAMVLFDPTRVVIDVGGPPQAISADGNTAVYAPAPGAEVPRTFRISGAARAFEATYLWRVTDAGGAVLAAGHGLASVGTSALWGAFATDVTLPAAASGNVTLEVYQVSPKDGSEVSLAALPLAVRP